MARDGIRLDRRGIAQLLKDPKIARRTHAVAGDIARQARSHVSDPSVEIVVDDYTTDRRASSVTIKDVRALGWQVRDGVLTRAAASVGLEVTEK